MLHGTVIFLSKIRVAQKYECLNPSQRCGSLAAARRAAPAPRPRPRRTAPAGPHRGNITN